MENEYGIQLSRNGYAPSILPTQDGECFLCQNRTHTERHEVFGGSNRTKSKALGLWVCLCVSCHRLSPYSVHQCGLTAKTLHRAAQIDAMKHYLWSEDEFRRRFGKSYLQIGEKA